MEKKKKKGSSCYEGKTLCEVIKLAKVRERKNDEIPKETQNMAR